MRSVDGKWPLDPSERAEYLQDTLLVRFNSANDCTTWEVEQLELIPRGTNVTPEEEYARLAQETQLQA